MLIELQKCNTEHIINNKKMKFLYFDTHIVEKKFRKKKLLNLKISNYLMNFTIKFINICTPQHGLNLKLLFFDLIGEILKFSNQ